MKNIIIAALFTVAQLAFAGPSSVDVRAGNQLSGMYFRENHSLADGFEANNENNVTDSSSIASVTSSSPISGNYSLAIDATTSGQLVKILGKTIKQVGAQCEAVFYYSGDATLYKAYVLQSSTKVSAEQQLTNVSTNRQAVSLPFPCGAGTAPDVTIEATDNAAAAITTDDFYSGMPINIGTVANPNVFTAKVSSAGVVSDETGAMVSDWINGSCSISDTSLFSCIFTTSFFTATPTCVVSMATDTSGVSQSATTGTVNSTSMQVRTLAGGGKSAQPFNITCTKTGADFTQTVVRMDQSGWYVDATMDGANPSLGVAAVTSYTEITSASLTLKPQSGTQPVGVMCSSTNAATAPSTSNTTCAAGDESVGINFNIVKPGTFEVCFYGSLYAEVDSAERVDTVFQLIETPTNAQTLTLEGGTRQSTGIKGQTIASGVDNGVQHPFTNCSLFKWDSVGTKGVRLMYEQSVTGTPDNVLLIGDASANDGQRNMRWTVRPWTEASQVLVAGGVTTDSGGIYKTIMVRVAGASDTTSCTSTPCTLYRNSGTSITAVNRTSTGLYPYVIAAGTFSQTPHCWAQGRNGAQVLTFNGAATSATAGTVEVYDNSATVRDAYFELFCQGPR